jgi:hypothetical protein
MSIHLFSSTFTFAVALRLLAALPGVTATNAIIAAA